MSDHDDRARRLGGDSVRGGASEGPTQGCDAPALHDQRGSRLRFVQQCLDTGLRQDCNTDVDAGINQRGERNPRLLDQFPTAYQVSFMSRLGRDRQSRERSVD